MLFVTVLLAFIASQLVSVNAALSCPLEGWYLRPTTVDAAGNVAGTCYYMSGVEANWEAAQAFCSQFSDPDQNIVSSLVSVHSIYENVFVFDNVTNRRSAWLGLNQKKNQGDWEWDDGSRVSYEFWMAGYPKEDDDLKCVSQAGPVDSRCGEWVNADCHTNLFYVCEMAASST